MCWRRKEGGEKKGEIKGGWSWLEGAISNHDCAGRADLHDPSGALFDLDLDSGGPPLGTVGQQTCSLVS